MKNLIIFLLAIATLASTTFGESTSGETKTKEPSRHDNIYYFQHRLLRNWTHESDGNFFDSLDSGIPALMVKRAKELVDEEFSTALKLEEFPEKQAYAIIFPSPQEAPECYFVVIRKEADGYSYYTLEKGLDIFERGNPSVLCRWTADGSHVNLGTRKYDDLDNFIRDVFSKKQMANKSSEPTNASRATK